MEDDDYTPTTEDVSALEKETSAPVIPLSDLIGSFDGMSTTSPETAPAPKLQAEKPVDDLLDLLSGPAPTMPARVGNTGSDHAAVGAGGGGGLGAGLDLLDFGPPPGANRGVASMPIGGAGAGGAGGFGGNLASIQPIRSGADHSNPFSSDPFGGDLFSSAAPGKNRCSRVCRAPRRVASRCNAFCHARMPFCVLVVLVARNYFCRSLRGGYASYVQFDVL